MLLFKILLVFHILGDFYFQSNKLSHLKNDKTRYLIIHATTYTIMYIPLFLISTKIIAVLLTLFILFITHIIIDHSMSKISHGNKCIKLLLIDQSIHILTLIIGWFILKNKVIDLATINDFLKKLELLVSFENIISIVLVFLLIGRPASIIIERIIPAEIKTTKEEHPSDKEIDLKDIKFADLNDQKNLCEDFEMSEQFQKNKINYGSLIGMLERIIIVLLAMLNLWSSIALVFTAKSIARFKQLEDKNFAQKYLIGTLLSLSITLIVVLIFMR